MPKQKRSGGRQPASEAAFVGRRQASLPHEFVLEALAPLAPWTRRMFGCLAVYVGERIVLILRDSQKSTADNGVWLATTAQHHAALQETFPHLRSIGVLGGGVTNWQLLPADSPDFETAALRACTLIRAHDPRIGKVPKPKRRGGKAAT